MLDGIKHTLKTGEPTSQFMWFVVVYAIQGVIVGAYLILR